MRRRTLFIALALLTGCRGHLLLDPSPQAVASGERNLAMMGCSTIPSRGMDICRVVEGSPVDVKWTLVLPVNDVLASGEVRIRFHDQVRTFEVRSNVMEIPLKSLLGTEIWRKSDDQVIQAQGRMKVRDGDFERFVEVLGYLFIVVLDPSYSPLPYDSGLVFSSTSCEIGYTSSGRSFVSCTPR